MRIGVDLDDTICRTTESVHNVIEKYAALNNLNPLDIMNDTDLNQKFFKEKLEEIYDNAEVKRDVTRVLRRLKSKGNEIYIITARNNENISDAYGITKKWLEKQKIEVDKIIVAAYGETKADVCKKNKIDLMIDDDPYNYKIVSSSGISCILFDDREKYDLRQDYMTNWLDIEKYIERMIKK